MDQVAIRVASYLDHMLRTPWKDNIIIFHFTLVDEEANFLQITPCLKHRSTPDSCTPDETTRIPLHIDYAIFSSLDDSDVKTMLGSIFAEETIYGRLQGVWSASVDFSTDSRALANWEEFGAFDLQDRRHS
ncbi:hypothetical protein J6590_105188 [Homalodisca vitripennis]|nr:hypothetical protein J6590_105188 [Homalodisca vitripennis]